MVKLLLTPTSSWLMRFTCTAPYLVFFAFVLDSLYQSSMRGFVFLIGLIIFVTIYKTSFDFVNALWGDMYHYATGASGVDRAVCRNYEMY